jgi:RNA polymerase sigma factor (sigma-70 family)
MDLQAFKQKVLPVQGRLFRLAKLFLRNREEAEDALQEVLMRLWTKRQQLDSYNSVEALAVQMTRNLCLDKLKSHANRTMEGNTDLTNVHAEGVSPYQQTELSDSAGLCVALSENCRSPSSSFCIFVMWRSIRLRKLKK